VRGEQRDDDEAADDEGDGDDAASIADATGDAVGVLMVGLLCCAPLCVCGGGGKLSGDRPLCFCVCAV
jgi:hypothetical protein